MKEEEVMEKVERALPILKRKRDEVKERPGLDDKVGRDDKRSVRAC